MTKMLSWLNSSMTSVVGRVGVIILLTLLLMRIVRVAARQLEQHLEKSVTAMARLARLKTLITVGRSVLTVSILVAALLMILQTFEINVTPLLAGVGVAGLALSLGAQTLIRDFIGGVLILFENQFSVGDVISVGAVTGSVEHITLRATYVRDLDGRLHLIPNGDIRILANLTAGWSLAVVDLNVDYTDDMGQVLQALEAAAQRAAADERIKNNLLEPPQVVSWAGFKDWAVQVRLTAKTTPGQQWAVMTVLRQYAVEALQTTGVRVAVKKTE